MSKISIFFFSTFLSILLTGFLLSDSRDVSKEKLDAYLIEILPIFQLKGLSYHYRDTTLSTTQGIGLYSHEDKKAIVKNSIFPLGNFSRVLLTLCFFRLEKMGKVNLENPLSLYFNSLSAKKSNPLTVRNLLESRVGLTYRNDEILFSENNNWILSIKDMEIDLLSQLQTLDQSDRSYKSVLETLLLMEILKEITKSNYVDFIKKEINIPLDVNFIFDLNVAKKKGLVSYTNFFNSTSKINHIKYNKFISPAIQVYGSMEDVVKVVEFILDPSSEFISKENKRKFFAPSSYFE
ncbi:MAG: hypothetical protein EBS19_14360, partial [Spirochaetia bacterium]|nr:hypothetical protein [Spirochaetia bacterium]